MSQQVLSDHGRCPHCNGSGWIIVTVEKPGYGLIDEADRCPYCSGQRRRQEDTGVPGKFADTDYPSFSFDAYSRDMSGMKKITDSFFQQYPEWEKSGKGLYLWSKTPGSGKTFLASSLARSVMIKYDRKMRFVTAPDYMATVGDSYKREAGAMDESQIYRECSFLVMDDLGAQKAGEWQSQEMFRIINQRMQEGLMTLYTSNYPPEKLNLDDRAIDRIIKTSVVIQMPEESIRRRQADNEQAEFLRRIGI